MTGPDPQGGALEPLVERVTEGLRQRRAELVAALARAAYRRAPAPRSDPAAVGRMLNAALEFIDGRVPGTLGVRATNPDDAPTVVEVNLEDAPFLLSTLNAELARQGLEVAEVLHPILGVERTPDGRVTNIVPARGAARQESYIRAELTERLPYERLEELADAVRAVLEDARAATRDYAAMREQVEEAAFATRASAGTRYGPEEVDETTAFLGWLLDNNVVLLGAREYDLVPLPASSELAVAVRPGSGLGILCDESASRYAQPVPVSELPAGLRRQVEGGDLLVVSRTNRASTVHRRERMIYVGVKKVAGDGTLEGERRFLGLFSQKAFAEPAGRVPVLRRKLRTILAWEDLVEQSHEERAVRALFEALPKHELFEADTADLHASIMALLYSQERQDVRLLCRQDPERGTTSALVAIPRDRFSARVRQRVQELLVERFGADAVDYHLSITEGDRALLHFLLHGGDRVVAFDELEREVLRLTRTWEDDLRVELERAYGEVEGHRLAARYAGVFPPGYTDRTPAAEAVADIAELELPDDVRMTLRPGGDGTAPLRFRLYAPGRGVELSAFVPILESLGLTIVEEVPHRLATGGGVTLHDFGVRPLPGVHVDVDLDGSRLAEAARAVWDGRAEADSLNRLVLHAGLAWEEVLVLRAYRRYRRQVGTTFTDAYQADALVEHPDVARGLRDLFAAAFDPARSDESPEDARRGVLDGIEAVERLDQDRILRGFLGMVDATLRTNFYRSGTAGRDALALKFDSSAVPDMPRPVPHVEVFVYAPDVEGVHLRGGPVARGGLRWSDRQEDVRTEVLGLMKAQMVKNAVIVPTGSKGGFVLKRQPADPSAVPGAVAEAYTRFVRALLDVTDNIVRGRCVPPQDVRCRDGDDPYLVVAPDRGTAALSDTANAVAAEYGFWLGDAFASGGSAGYDHKAMGITARGAWVAVQRHFRELDVDVQTEPVTVVGIGDMSGDVFGNGLLCSRAARLVGAFDHRHVFLDPDPDPAASFEERARLFGMPGSSWADYDRSVLSAGGGVWARTAKTVPLSAEVRALLRVDAEALSPPELVRALLRAPVDLLFAGGIGTFVKASTETDGTVADRANDSVRIDATELGARVVGEGGNLALTQRARIEYARRGGRCNTDAIDNAGGVATSDREVNLKILLHAAAEQGELAPGERAAVLTETTDDVAAAVLRTIYRQAWVLSREVASGDAIEAYEQLMVDLGRGRPGTPQATRLDRRVEALPDTAEVQRRREAGARLTRPELAVLLGYTKIDLVQSLLDSDMTDRPVLAPLLHAYFPPAVTARFPEHVDAHRLRRELVATELANEAVDRMGLTYASRTAQELGCPEHRVVGGYWMARQVVGAPRYWDDIEALDQEATPALQLEIVGALTRLLDACARRYVREGALEEARGIIARDQAAFDELAGSIAELGSPGRRAARHARVERYLDLGLEDGFAARAACLAELLFVPDVAEVSGRSGRAVTEVADVFLELSERLPFDVLQAQLDTVPPGGRWRRWQVRGLADDLRDLRRDAAARALSELPAGEAGAVVERFLRSRQVARGRLDAVVERAQRTGDAGLDGVAVAVRALRELVASRR